MEKRSLKPYIDTKELEKYYLSLCPMNEKGKRYISVQTMEKMMLLEIYKELCTNSDNNVDDSNNHSKD